MKSARRVLATVATIAVAVGAAFAAPVSSSAATPVSTIHGFVNYQLGAMLKETCPNSTSSCQNIAAEPAIRADKFGNFFGTSENGVGAGTEAWKSVDGGLHYTHLASPNQASSPTTGQELGLSPGGGDTDLAIAPMKNGSGFYNVYVASLAVAQTIVSTSTTGGNSWVVNPGVPQLPGQDREWIAADGRTKVCISYVSAAGVLLFPAGLHVQCSYDSGGTFAQVSDAVSALNIDPRFGFRIGNLMIDQNSAPGNPAPTNDIVYQTFVSGNTNDATNPSPTGNHIVWMAVSMNGGQTFTDYQVYNNPDATVDYGHQFPNVTIDRAGNVYSFFTDDHSVYYKFSTNHGQTWLPTGAPIRVSVAPANTAIFPWATAGDPGKVDLVYYGTSFEPSPTYPSPAQYPAEAAWYVYFTQNLNATTTSSTWTQTQASPINHYGAVCESGVGCTGNRDLYDDFGVAASPTTGLASIIYSDDQFDQFNTAFPTNCTATQNNTGACDHTSIATQTTGSGIFGGGGGGGCHEGDGGGDMQSAKAGTAHASFDADSCEDGDHDQVQASDPGAGENFKSSQVQSIQFDDVARSVTLFGTGVSNGKPVNFQMVAVDNGTLPGSIFLSLDDGYTLLGTLINGSISLK